MSSIGRGDLNYGQLSVLVVLRIYDVLQETTKMWVLTRKCDEKTVGDKVISSSPATLRCVER
jgi:hypothetical protein